MPFLWFHEVGSLLGTPAPMTPAQAEAHSGQTSLCEVRGIILIITIQIEEVLEFCPVLILPVPHLAALYLWEVQVFQLEGQGPRAVGEGGSPPTTARAQLTFPLMALPRPSPAPSSPPNTPPIASSQPSK